MDVQIRRLDRKIKLVSNSPDTDEIGGVRDNKTEKTVRAKVEYKGGSEKDAGGVMIDDGRVFFTIRYRSVDLDDWIEFKSKRYDIERIEEIARNRYLRLVCNATTG